MMHRLPALFGYLFVAFLAVAATLGHAVAQQTNFSAPALDPTAGKTFTAKFSAVLKPEAETIERGLVWRVFSATKGEDDKHPLIASAKGGSQTLDLPGGAYLVHVSFGRASATKRVSVGAEAVDETFVLDAGGLVLNADADGKALDPRFLRFTIHAFRPDENGERPVILSNVRPDTVVRLKAGTYHVVSTYGDINASVRADLEVNAGEITQAQLQHRGAKVTLRLVLRKGGDPVANTAWTVLSRDGEKLFESNAIQPTLALAEGSYEASVRNGNEVYVHNFEVRTGEDQRVEVLLK